MISPLRVAILWDNHTLVRHIRCGGRLSLEHDGFTNPVPIYVCTGCDSQWRRDVMAVFTVTQLNERFEFLPPRDNTAGRLVWRSEGKAKFLSVVPADEAGEPSGLS